MIRAVHPLSDGGCLLAGKLNDFRTEGESPWLMKVSPEGEQVWSNYYEFSRNCSFHDVTELSDGSIVGVGRLVEDEGFGGANYLPIAVHANSAGAVQHRAQVGTQYGDYRTVAPTGDGNVIVAGRGTVEDGYGTAERGRVSKLDTTLSRQWRSLFGSGEWHHVQEIVPGANDEYIAVGTASPDDGDNGWVLTVDDQGQKVWDSTFGGDSDDWLRDLTVADDGTITAVGNSSSLGPNHKNSWVLQTDPRGNGLWSYTFQTSDEVAEGITEASSNGFIVASRAGELYESITHDPEAQGGVIRKVGPDGTEEWTQQFEGGGYEFRDVAAQNDVYLSVGRQGGAPAWGVGLKEVQNQVPSPSITVPNERPGLAEVTFDASNSRDDGEITTYNWDFNQDGSFERSGQTVSYTFENEGEHQVTLQVTDDMGSTATTTVTVEVVNKPPEPAFELSENGVNVGEYVELDGTVSEDPDGNIQNYAWDVGGDGDFESTGEIITVEFEEPGQKEIVLRVTDENGETKTVSRTIEVLPEGVTPTPTPRGGSTGGPSNGSGGVSQPGFGLLGAAAAALVGAGAVGIKKLREER